jgi:hypothetical protein
MNKVILIIIIVVLFWAGSKGFQKVQNLPKTDLAEADLDKRMMIEDILKEANRELNNRRENDDDISAGPCLLNPSTINEDYVVDIAHEPRNDDDNNKINQCSDFVEGRATHFIEVDVTGKLLRFN